MTASTTDPEPVPSKAGLPGGWLAALFVALVVAGGIFALFRGDDQVAELGQPAPALAVTLFDGEVFDLVEHVRQDRGPVLLNLWASWCLPCREEFPALSDFADANPGVTVVGVAVRDQEGHARDFATEMQPSFLVGWDADGAIGDAYPAFALPATFVIDPDGRVSEIILAQLTPERLATITFSS